MFQLLLKKIFIFSTTFKPFGAETRVTEIQQASNNLALPHLTSLYLTSSIFLLKPDKRA